MSEDNGAELKRAADGESAPEMCRHPSHRTVRLFCSYGPASVVRLSLKDRISATRIVVSPLRRIEDGWSFTMCGECLVEDGEANGNGSA